MSRVYYRFVFWVGFFLVGFFFVGIVVRECEGELGGRGGEGRVYRLGEV